ncbi:MAG: diaminopimelate epimerase [Rickettsiaceae bacterium]|nr:diaminopimelate epimerase [Rickettsiaceae bacterium]
MHGLGNDFIIISKNELPKSTNINSFIAKICHRRLGIGADQFIIYNQDNKISNKYHVDIYNQDGSPAEACGNAMRCIARLIYDNSQQKEIVIAVAKRNIHCNYITKDEISVDMGVVSFDKAWMPNNDELWNLANNYGLEPKEVICVDVGNPHLVIFTELSDKDKKIIGKDFEKHELFKDGVNVNFPSLINDKIYLKVWERGTGFTLACGSGAAASFAASHKLGFVSEKAEVIFDLGTLKMAYHNNNIVMNGSATYVFLGEYVYD